MDGQEVMLFSQDVVFDSRARRGRERPRRVKAGGSSLASGSESSPCLGLVVETPEQYASSSDSDDEDGKRGKKRRKRVPKGSVRVAWYPNGKEQVVKLQDLSLVDRSVLPSEIVRRIGAEDSRRASVTNTHIKCLLNIIGTRTVIADVDSHDLLHFTGYSTETGDVCLDSWLGRVEDIGQTLTLKLSDGARCVIKNDDLYQLDGFRNIHASTDRDTEFSIDDFYEGQLLMGELGALKHVEWLHSTRAYSPATVKRNARQQIVICVEKAVTDSISVRWMGHGFLQKYDGREPMMAPPGVEFTPPSVIVTGDDLNRVKLLDWFGANNVRLCDKGYYVIKDSDRLQVVTPGLPLTSVLKVDSDGEVGANSDPTLNGGTTLSGSRGRKRGREDGSSSSESGENEGVDEAPSNATAKPATDLPAKLPGGRRKVLHGSSAPARKGAGGLAVRRHSVGSRIKSRSSKASLKDMSLLAAAQFSPGEKVAVEVIHTATTVDIMWQDASAETSVPTVELYPIQHLDDLEYFPGDFVIPSTESNEDVYGVIQSVEHTGRTCKVVWIKHAVGGMPETLNAEELSVYDIKDHRHFKYRLGNVVIRIPCESQGQLKSCTPSMLTEGSGSCLVIQNDACQTCDRHASLQFPTAAAAAGSETPLQNCEAETGMDVLDQPPTKEVATSTESCLRGACSELKDSKTAKIETDDASSIVCVATCSHRQLVTGADAPETDASVTDSFVSALSKNSAADAEAAATSASTADCLHAVEGRAEQDEEVGSSLSFESFLSAADMYGTAAGQITEVLLDGRLRVAWADGHQSVCYPFDLYLISEEPGDFPEEGNQPTEEQEGGEGGDDQGSAEGWVTEEEEEVLVGSAESGVESSDEEGGTTAKAQCKKNIRNTSKLPSYLSAVFGEQSAVMAALVQSPFYTRLLTIFDKFDYDIQQGTSSCKTAGPTIKLSVGKGFKRVCKQVEQSLVQMNDDLVEFEASLRRDHVATSDATPPTDKQSCVDCGGASPRECSHALPTSDGPSAPPPAPDPSFVQSLELRKELMRQLEQSQGGFLFEIKSFQVVAAQLEKCFTLLLSIASLQHGVCVHGIGVTSLQHSSCVTLPLMCELHAAKEDACEAAAAKRDEPSRVQGEVSSGEGRKEDPVEEVEENEEKEPAVLKSDAAGRAENGRDASANRLGFSVVGSAPDQHRFKENGHEPTEPKSFMKAIRSEYYLLRSCLPRGILVNAYESRMDLLSVLVEGPAGTPYEDGLFLFDVQLPPDYPSSPPLLHYVSHCSERLNPNLYEDGKVCISLLGTWTGKGTEVWSSTESNLLQVLVSVQGLILNDEPYYNEPGFEKLRSSATGFENSRLYNEMVLVKLVQSMHRMLISPSSSFKEEILQHMERNAYRLMRRLEYWLDVMPVVSGATVVLPPVHPPKAAAPLPPSSLSSSPLSSSHADDSSSSSQSSIDQSEQSNSVSVKCDQIDAEPGTAAMPQFPLLPVSKGFRLTLVKVLEQFKVALAASGVSDVTH